MRTGHRASRNFDEWRVEVNDSIEALLLATDLAQIPLDAITNAGRTYLSDVYPTLGSGQRLHRPMDDVKRMVRGAEGLMAAMAIPFVVSVFNDYLVEVLRLFHEDAQYVGKDGEKLQLADLRVKVRGLCRSTAPAPYEKLTDFVQALRNDIIHRAGRTSDRLTRAWSEVDSAGRRVWTDAAKRAPVLKQGQKVEIGPGEVRAAQAVLLRQVQAIDKCIQTKISKTTWARIAVADYCETHTAAGVNYERKLRKAMNYARMMYGPIRLTTDDLGPHLSSQLTQTR